MAFEKDLNLEATELRLGLPGTSPADQSSPINRSQHSNKRALPSDDDQKSPESGRENNSDPTNCTQDHQNPPPTKAQVVGWPPVRSFRKNNFQAKKKEEAAAPGTMFVKVSMDGAPFLRKVDLKIYQGYPDLLQALENMFKFSLGKFCEREGYNGSEFVPTYEDKDGDWMLVGDVPWEMFMSSCKKFRIMKGSEAKGLGCGSV